MSHLPLDADLFRPVALVVLAGLFFWHSGGTLMAADDSLQILDAGIERSEDAPFVPSGYHFMAGDYLYFRFQVSGYAIRTSGESEVRKLSLEYEIVPQDAQGVALTAAVTGAIKDELNAEDKNWTPKRRASFLLPSYVAAGEYHLHILVKDLFGNTKTERDLPFQMGGTVIVPSATLAVQDFAFLRNEDDAEPLEVPAYRPGDTVFVRFNMTGFQFDPQNKYDLTFGITVYRPDGKIFLQEAEAAKLSDSSFYPARFVPASVNITTTHASAHGQYVVVISARDQLAKRDFQVKRSFSLE